MLEDVNLAKFTQKKINFKRETRFLWEVVKEEMTENTGREKQLQYPVYLHMVFINYLISGF